MNSWLWMGTALLIAVCWGPAQAAEFNVGRATVVFATDDWSVVDVSDETAGYGGDLNEVIPSVTKLFFKAAAQGSLQAVAVVRASTAGVPRAYMTYSLECDSNQKSFAEGDTGSATRLARCLAVYPSSGTQSLLSFLGESRRSLLEVQKDQLPVDMYLVTSDYWSSNGTFVSVRVWLAPGFEGLPGTVSEPLPEGVLASNVVWGRALNLAVRSSVTSIFGKLEFPALTFKATAPASSANGVEENAPPSR